MIAVKIQQFGKLKTRSPPNFTATITDDYTKTHADMQLYSDEHNKHVSCVCSSPMKLVK